MAKQLRCADLGQKCNAVIDGKDEGEVMAKAAAHAKKDHGMATIPPEMMPKIKAAIKEKK